MSKHLCLNCGRQFQHNSVGARLVLGVTGAALGRANPYAGIIGIILGVAFGSEIDKFIEERIDPTCPECGLVIRGLARSLSFANN